MVTFDAAHTLLHVDWNPPKMATEALIAAGEKVDAQVAGEVYNRLLQGRWVMYQEVNKSASAEVCREFWLELTQDWLAQLGLSVDLVPAVVESVEARLRPGGDVYHVYDDVVPCLESLKAKGLRLAVISNWDFTLQPTLEAFELDGYFEVITASLVFGVEKPDRAIFEHTLGRLGVEPGVALHVGDDPMADFHGAVQAGMQAKIIDRSGNQQSKHVIDDLRQLVELV